MRILKAAGVAEATFEVTVPVGIQLGHHHSVYFVDRIKEVGSVVGAAPVISSLGREERLLADILDDAEAQSESINLFAVNVHVELADLVASHHPNRAWADKPVAIQFSLADQQLAESRVVPQCAMQPRSTRKIGAGRFMRSLDHVKVDIQQPVGGGAL